MSKKYQVDLIRYRMEEATVIVAANSKNQIQQYLLEHLNQNDFPWYTQSDFIPQLHIDNIQYIEASAEDLAVIDLTAKS